MKKFVAIICIICLLMPLVSCKKQPIQTITEINISDESVKVRDELFGLYKLSEKTEDEIKASTENTLKAFEKRTDQVFPEVETKNTLEKITLRNGDTYTLSKDSFENIVMYIHGGAWTYEITSTHVKYCDKLVDELNAKVYMPIYPLVPQVTYEEMYFMLREIYEDLLAKGKPIIIMGDSAGATLALGFTHILKNEGITLPSKVVVFSPCADASFSNEEIKDYESKDGMLPRYECAKCAELWAGTGDMTDPCISPFYGNYQGFPDTLMFIGTYDILCPDELKLYDKMCQDGMNVSLVKGNGFWHVYPEFDISESEQCMNMIKEFCIE